MVDNDEIGQLRAALEATKERLDDLVGISRRSPFESPPYDNIPIIKGTAKRIAHVLTGGAFNDDIYKSA